MLRLLFSFVRNIMYVSVSWIALCGCSLNLSYIVFWLCICFCHCLFVGQVMSPHHNQMSQRSHVSQMTLVLVVFFNNGSEWVSQSMMKPPIELTLSSQKDLTPDNLITSSTRILAQPGIGLKRRDMYILSFSEFSEMCQHVLTTLLRQGHILTYLREIV